MPSATLTTAVFQLESLISSISPETDDAPTPCSEWVVRDLVDHVLHTTAGLTQMVKGEEVDWSAPVEHHDDSLAEFRQRGAALLAAADDAQLGLPAAELAVHTWDLATALGQGTDDLDPAVAEVGHAFMLENLGPEQRQGAFDPEKPAPEGANAYERLAAFAGRSVTRD
ncbi:maleylpyruvate isomerase family mycothiol-dependent enzyme [Aeromicrobium sp. Leaf350]|uniref:maleylpyruvate isomerase family mycothiol-dependent enzyme n=1 Tax=Aeromicrobium sp. Leaf350 TaxID=2876565 RepID=UPI001E6020B4|nr:maleylpyruvate isomerase family mycothiol-dependent enzyme [Aeromicrobium sp. Leaf350]